MTKERMKRLRENRKALGLIAREVFLSDFEFGEFKKWLAEMRRDNEQKKVRQGNGSTDDAAP